MLTILVETAPWTPGDRIAAPLRIAGGGSRGYNHRGHSDWLAGVVGMPRFTTMIGFGPEGWTGGAIPTTGAVAFHPSNPETLSALSGYAWPGAPITLMSGDDVSADPEWTVELAGTVAGVTVKQGLLSLTISDLSGALADPLLVSRFAGTGGIEGGAETKDRTKRRSWGRCFNVEGRIFDKANGLWEFGDPAFPLQDFATLKDRGRAYDPVVTVGWQGSQAATLAALIAAPVPDGGIAKAPSIALAKPWTLPAGPITADILGEVGDGYVETAPAIAVRLVAARSALTISNVVAMSAARPGPAGIHVDNESETTAAALDRLLFGVSIVWVLEPDGSIRLSEISYDDPVETIVAIDVEREAAYKAISARVLGYQRNHRIHTDAEISAVFQASDGTYADGTPIEDLKPGEGGATRGAVIGTGPTQPGTLFDLEGNPIEREDVITSEGTAADTAAVAGRPSDELVSDTDAQAMAALYARADQEVARIRDKGPLQPGEDGADIKTLLTRLFVSRDGHTASIEELFQVLVGPAGALARALLTLDVDGRITGYRATNDGSTGVFDILADLFRITDPDTGLPMLTFVTETGKLVTSKVVVDELAVNTAVVPVPFYSPVPLPGAGSTWINVINTTITMAKDGYVEVTGAVHQGFNSGDQDWEIEVYINGVVVQSGAAGHTQDEVPLYGHRFCGAGDIPVLIRWRADSSVTLTSHRGMIKGWPATLEVTELPDPPDDPPEEP